MVHVRACFIASLVGATSARPLLAGVIGVSSTTSNDGVTVEPRGGHQINALDGSQATPELLVEPKGSHQINSVDGSQEKTTTPTPDGHKRYNRGRDEVEINFAVEPRGSHSINAHAGGRAASLQDSGLSRVSILHQVCANGQDWIKPCKSSIDP